MEPEVTPNGRASRLEAPDKAPGSKTATSEPLSGFNVCHANESLTPPMKTALTSIMLSSTALGVDGR